MKSKSLEDALAELEAKKARTAEYIAKHAPEIEAATAKRKALNAKLAALPQKERRQVLDAAGLKHVSAAPPPLEPIRSSGYTQPRTPAALPAIDWHYWGHMPEIRQWEACALSLNINPDNMKHHPQGWMTGTGCGPIFTDASFPSNAEKIEFGKRERLLGASLFSSGYFTAANNLVMGGRHLATVNLREFAAWGLHVELEAMPPELVAMAATATTASIVMPEQDTATPVPVVTAGASDGVEPETPQQRRARWLLWRDEAGEGRGAVQRVYERERKQNPRADRSFIGKEIKKAEQEKAQAKQAGVMYGQLVQDGKRTS